MRRFPKTVLLLSLLLTGCGIGGFWMEGISGQAREDYLKSIKPYIAYWEKPGMTEEGRREDWVACGGMYNGSYSSVTPSGSTTQTILEASEKKRKQLDACMENKGYYWIGSCRVRETPTCARR